MHIQWQTVLYYCIWMKMKWWTVLVITWWLTMQIGDGGRAYVDVHISPNCVHWTHSLQTLLMSSQTLNDTPEQPLLTQDVTFHCACMCVCVFVYVCMCLCVHMCVHVCMFAYVGVCVWVHEYAYFCEWGTCTHTDRPECQMPIWSILWIPVNLKGRGGCVPFNCYKGRPPILY